MEIELVVVLFATKRYPHAVAKIYRVVESTRE